MRLAAVLVVALALPAAAAAQPTEPAPRGALPGTPHAWVQTAAGDFWLAPSTTCWSWGCADYAEPRCKTAPTIRLRRGERVLFHLPFSASGAALQVGKRHFRLDGGRSFSWSARRGGLAMLATDSARGAASFAACFRVERAELIA